MRTYLPSIDCRAGIHVLPVYPHNNIVNFGGCRHAGGSQWFRRKLRGKRFVVINCGIRAMDSGNDEATPSRPLQESQPSSQAHAVECDPAKGETLQKSEMSVKEGSNYKDGIMMKLQRFGLAGILSYGLLNTLYYLGMFMFAWFYIAPAPSGLGYRAAVGRFIKLFALVWAGSQVTKVPRAGCALALAPAIDRGLTWFTAQFKFQSRSQAFAMIVASCFGLALIIFLIMTALWA